MELYSTKKQVPNVNFQEALFKGLPSDNGLYMPSSIGRLDDDFIKNIEKYSFEVIAFKMAQALIGDEIPAKDLQEIVMDAIDFKAPVKPIIGDAHVLELFHGPSYAFKDFGARFMARCMAYFLRNESREINILVATSGDTGSAVAQGFLGVPGIKVTILYPSGKVSANQEKQLTTLGQNITALEIDGVFDDCQRLVKSAFLDEELNAKLNLSSANSINIARLVPQSFYYGYAYAQVKHLGKPVVFAVPSGNFGNLCGGLFAQKMGIPIDHFVAATNVNDVVPSYLKSGLFESKDSVATLSNAMDVGNPSNFPRLQAIHENDLEKMRANITGKAYADEITVYAMKKVFDETEYVMCPHTAVAFMGLVDYLKESGKDATGIFLSTAHPAKFKEIVDEVVDRDVLIPEPLQKIIDKEKKSIEMSADFEGFKAWLMQEG